MDTSEPINAAPTVLDVSSLPKRQVQTSEKLAPLVNDDAIDFALYHSAANQSNLDVPALTDASSSDEEDEGYDPIDAQEIYDLISTISDPEHPLTLGQLAVVNLQHITVQDSGNANEISTVLVEITPTITHCSLATLIGLGIRVRLDRCLPSRFRIMVKVRPGTHQSESQVNKQLNDKERVAAACENEQLAVVVSNMLSTCQ